MIKSYQVRIAGRVQGVFYRASMCDKAKELGVGGFVKNMKDGSVYAEIQGEEEILKKMIEWSNHGPIGAKVEEIKVNEQSKKDYKNFEIRRD
ncbi:MAG: acylphosphatase [Cyclobacteriaceae bacterium]